MTIIHSLVWGQIAIAVVRSEIHYTLLKEVDELIDHPGGSPLYGYVALKRVLASMANRREDPSAPILNRRLANN